MLATSRGGLLRRLSGAHLSLALTLLLTGCGTGAYEERLDATVAAQRAGKAPGEAAEPPAAPAGAAPVDPAVQNAQAAEAAAATNAAGQGVAGRAILAPTDAFP